MSSVLERTLSILELLARHPDGLPVSAIAGDLDMPVSGAHRLLGELARFGYVRQLRAQGDYALTIKLASMGLSFLGQSGVTEITQPILDRLAQVSGELVRLSVLDGPDLVWVGVAQGATTGLRYDAGREQGVVIHLASSAGGQAYLSTLSDDGMLEAVGRQGLKSPNVTGPGAPTSLTQLMEQVQAARARGYSVSVDSYHVGMAAFAVPVRHGHTGDVLGCLSIAGPAVRVTPDRMEELAPQLIAAAAEIGDAADASTLLRRSARDGLRKSA